MKSPALKPVVDNLIQVWKKRTRGHTIDFRQRFKILLRSLGFGLVALVRRSEPRKILIYRSRLLALAHCAVHIVPAAGSFALVSLNFQGRFIGAELQGEHFTTDDIKLAAIQVAAKLHELLIVASLSTIIFHVIRSDLIFGRGVPLGLLGSGWNFAQFTYFFSPEFWGGALTGSRGRNWKEYRLVLLLVIAGLVATFVGPATAVLATPRISPWPIGGSSYWLNGSRPQLWPTDLDSNALQNYNCSTTEAKIYDPRCPSAGYDFLYQHFKTWWQYGDRRDMLEFNIQDYSMVKRIYARVSDDTRVDTYAWTTHWPTAMLQDAKRDLYDSSLIWLRDNHRHDPPYPGYLDLATEKTFAVKTEVPYVRTACVSGYTIDIVKETLNSSIVMQFPAHNGNWGFPRDWEGFTPGPIPYLSQQFDTAAVIQQHFQSRGFLDYQEDGGITLNATIPAVVTVPVTLAANNSTEMGMAILVRNADSSTFNAYSCIVDPFWAPGQSIIVSNKNSNGGYHEWRKDRVRNVVTTELGSLDEAQFIRVQPGWYDLLSPMLPDSTEYGSLRPGRVPSSSNRSLMERLLENVLYPLFEDPLGGLPSARSVEYAISAYFADGLSRCGSTIQTNASGIAGWPAFRPDDNRMARSLVFKGSPKLKGESAKPAALAGYEATEMLMTAVFTGYLLATIGSFDYFAVAVLLLHAAMALGYTVLVFLWYPDIMEALDSIPEMVAMAQNSRPPDNDGLKNTSAGIRHFKTLGRLAIVETSRALDESDGKEELVLRFQETERDARRIPQIGREYGGIKSI